MTSSVDPTGYLDMIVTRIQESYAFRAADCLEYLEAAYVYGQRQVSCSDPSIPLAMVEPGRPRRLPPNEYVDFRCPACGEMLTEHVIVTRHAAGTPGECDEFFTGPPLMASIHSPHVPGRAQLSSVSLSWRDVFDASKAAYGLLDKAIPVAVRAGYRFVAWNDRVYDVALVDGAWMPTDLGSVAERITS